MKTIYSMKPGEVCQVVKIHSSGPLKRRFNDMGLICGAEVEFIKTAPLGDPLQIKVKDTNLAIRIENAEQIEVK